jgi:hypothetical protein
MSRPVTLGVNIRVFLIDGTPQGLRTVERIGWTGICLAFSRSDYSEARQRGEARRTGVYILVGPDPEGTRVSRVYIGEADAVFKRLDSHQKEKDFWTNGYILTTTDNSLNKAQVRYLESRLIDLAKETDVAALDNGTAPDTTRLNEPDVAAMESYLEYALGVLPLVGVDVFDVVDDDPALTPTHDDEESTPIPPTVLHSKVEPNLYLETGGVLARARDESRGFVVVEGSTARVQKNVMIPTYEALRSQLISEGALELLDHDTYVLTKPIVFKSPSAAASVLMAGSLNGRLVWKDITGKTLKELQSSSASVPLQAAPGILDEEDEEDHPLTELTSSSMQAAAESPSSS